ncbi:HET-D protein [Alternaria alternata]|nr:HET-D protein [Alternaria alternata]
MRLLSYGEDGRLTLSSFDDNAIPRYAILSHTWGVDAEEVTFADLAQNGGRHKPGYKKIRFCGEQAQQDGLQYFWVDTCCIDKTDKAELSFAIQSMFRWYQNATKCYVYLLDVSTRKRKFDDMFIQFTWKPAFRSSRWFMRGWTLQELLAPNIVEFFSQEWERLGDKISLALLISKITGIPHQALQGTFSQFDIEDRLRWKGDRKTKLKEDIAYSLSGICNVDIAPVYGEGEEEAFRRLYDKIRKREECLRDLRATDPRNDKKRIEEIKGGLLADSYHWVLNNTIFQQWQQDPHSRLLWMKGDPGKGKTMLLCGIINELQKATNNATVSYFFCQATDSRINSATSIIRGLLYMLVDQQPSLMSHIRRKYACAGKALFEDANAWVALSEVFTSMTQDKELKPTYLVVDALDECVVDLSKLLDLIVRTSTLSLRVKWLVSSRNENYIEEKLKSVGNEAKLSLELRQNAEQVTRAVDVYIDHKLSCLESLREVELRKQVRDELHQKANGTFLWVALVIHELEKPESWDPLAVVEEAPAGLHQLYDRMMDQIQRLSPRNADTCRSLLCTAVVAYRPLYLVELGSLRKLLGRAAVLPETVNKIVAMCGSFLTIRDEQVYLVHQSAKDYLSDKMRSAALLTHAKMHYDLYTQSLELMSSTLKRNMYNLDALDSSIEEAKIPDPDPLATTRYSCVYWVDHLYDSKPKSLESSVSDLQVANVVDEFLRKKYLYWLEGLSLCKSVEKGIVSMTKLWSLMQLFQHEEPEGISIMPALGDSWSACLQTIEGHSGEVHAVAFSHDSTWLASASNDRTVKIWDASSGACLQTLEGHSSRVSSVAFSHDSTRLASGSNNSTVKIWDVSSGACLQTIEGHGDDVSSVAFSLDSAQLASASHDQTVKIWDVSSGVCLQTLNGHCDGVSSVAFSPDSTQLASASYDDTVKIWDASSGACLQTLEGHSLGVTSVAFSPDSAQLASASYDNSVKIWDASSGACLQTIEGHGDGVSSVAFSPDSAQLVSASHDDTVKIWNARSGMCLQTLEGHTSIVWSVVFSPDSTQLASASHDKTVKIWDTSSCASLQTLEGHSGDVHAVAFSPDSAQLASASHDETVKIWDVSSGVCLQTLNGHCDGVSSVTFSPDSTQLASASYDKTVKIWDASSGVCLQTSNSYSHYSSSVAFSPDSTQLASAWNENTVTVWDACSGVCLQTLEGHGDEVSSVAFSPDSTQLASASYDDTVKIWDASSGACLQTLEGHSLGVTSVAFSPDSAQLASASHDETVKIWDASSGACLQTIEGHGDGVSSVAFSPDSAQLSSASYDNTVKIWNARSGVCLQTLNGHGKGVSSVAFSPDSAQLASASHDQTVKIWDASSGVCLQTLKGHSRIVRSVAFFSDSARLASASNDSTIKIWDANSGVCLQTLEGHEDGVSSVAFSPDSAQLASASDGKNVKIWDVSNWICLQTLEGDSDNGLTLVVFSPDSAQLASASYNYTVKIWDASSGACLQTLKGHSDLVYSVAFSHDSEQLASASCDSTVRIWDASSGACLLMLERHSDSNPINLSCRE